MNHAGRVVQRVQFGFPRTRGMNPSLYGCGARGGLFPDGPVSALDQFEESFLSGRRYGRDKKTFFILNLV